MIQVAEMTFQVLKDSVQICEELGMNHVQCPTLLSPFDHAGNADFTCA